MNGTDPQLFVDLDKYYILLNAIGCSLVLPLYVLVLYILLTQASFSPPFWRFNSAVAINDIFALLRFMIDAVQK